MVEIDGQKILVAAATRKGIRYGLPPNGTTTLDCSLYVLLTYRDAGYPIEGARTAEQIRQKCDRIDLAVVKSGDLLFFEHTYEPDEPAGPDGRTASHVGISLGAGTGLMWDAHSSDDSGLPGVGVTNIFNPYWQQHLFQAGRPRVVVAPAPPPPQPKPATDGLQPMRVAGTNGLGLRVREQPTTVSRTAGRIDEGEHVQAGEHPWRWVKTGNLEGWASADYLEPAPAELVAPDATGPFTAEQVAFTLNAPLASVNEHLPRIYAALDEVGIGDRATAVAALATIGVETAHRFEPIHEFRNADGSIPSYWHSYDGGAEFHGRGFIQITHRSNYAQYGEQLGIDLVANPDLALDPDIAARILARFFRDHNISGLAAAGDWHGVRQAVNGGDNGWPEFNRYVQMLLKF